MVFNRTALYVYKVSILFAKGRDIAMVDAVLGDTKAAEMMGISIVLKNPGLAIHGCRCQGSMCFD